MAAPAGSILPPSYFDGLSTLWGGCAYVASAIVAAGFAFQIARMRPDPVGYVWLFAKVFLIGIATLFIREWLMRLSDIMVIFGAALGVDPTAVDDKFITFVSGKTATEPDASIWDVIWGTKSIGTAICYALLWLFGWLSWGIQYIVKLIGGILLTAGWALSPVFLAFFMIRPLAGVGLKYIIGLAALVCWPFGWVVAAVVTNAMLDAAATASLIPVVIPGSMVGPGLTVLLVGAWMIVSSVLAPYITTKVLLMGANPAAAFAQGSGGVAQAVVAGGLGAAGAAATGGVGTAGVVAAAALGAIASGAESSARGGGSARTTGTALSGLSGFSAARDMRKRTAAHERGADAFVDMAKSARSMAADRAEQAAYFREMRRTMRRQERGHAAQPHHDDPNKAALEIEVYARK